MIRRVLLAVLWVLLVALSVWTAPAGDGLDGARVLDFFLFQGEPMAVAVFNLLGVFPLVFLAILLRDPPQRVPMLPFALLSFAMGAFALLPGLVLRRATPASRALGRIRRWLSSWGLGAFLSVAALGLVAFGLTGTVEGLLDEAADSTLVHVMSLDFLCLCAAWPIVLAADAERHRGPAWRVHLGVVPVVGPALWILVRGTPEGAGSSAPDQASASSSV